MRTLFCWGCERYVAKTAKECPHCGLDLDWFHGNMAPALNRLVEAKKIEWESHKRLLSEYRKLPWYWKVRAWFQLKRLGISLNMTERDFMKDTIRKIQREIKIQREAGKID